MNKIELKSRKFLRKIFNGISLTAVAFIFQACYGMPGELINYEVKFTGTVKSKTSNLPVKGIKVSVHDPVYNIGGITDENGKFDFYAGTHYEENDGGKVKLHFIDIDGVENGHFADTTIVVMTKGIDEVVINMALNEKR